MEDTIFVCPEKLNLWFEGRNMPMILSVGCKFTLSFSDTDYSGESSVINSNNDICTIEASKKRIWLIQIILTKALLYICTTEAPKKRIWLNNHNVL